jgi:hypothetical protein
MTIGTRRDIAESILLNKFKGVVRPYTPKESGIIEKYKDGSYGLSNLAFALYSNGLNPRGRSSRYPYGMVFEDGETLFSIGYYRKELEPEESDGYLFVVAPRGKNATKKIMKFTDVAISDCKILCKGVYVRFLARKQQDELLYEGFVSVDESNNPWHQSAPREDETFSHSLITLNDITNRKLRLASNRFDNFLKRNGLEYNLRRYHGKEDHDTAKLIIRKHFEMLRKMGRQISSVPEDHYNSIDPNLTKLNSVFSYLGFLDDCVPVSLFVGEKVSDRRVALYTPFTIRNVDEILGNEPERKRGLTAMPIGAYLTLFEDLKSNGIEEVLLGGSELKSLDDFKREMGAKPDPSYWTVKLK